MAVKVLKLQIPRTFTTMLRFSLDSGISVKIGDFVPLFQEKVPILVILAQKCTP